MSEHPPTPPERTPPPVPPEDGVDPSLDIQSQDLPPKVRSYVDTLRQQVRDIFQKYGITTTGFRDAAAQLTARQDVSIKDLEHFRDINRVLIEIHKTGELPPEARESRPVTATVREDALATIPAEQGKEVTLDLREVLDSSVRFLTEKAPPTWAQSLREQFPHGITLTPDQRKTIETAIEHGFTHALLMPGGDTQGITTVETQKPDPNDPTKQITEREAQNPALLRQTMDHLLKTCAVAPVLDLPIEEQYIAPDVFEPEKTKVPTLRLGAPSRASPCLLLYGPGPIPASLKNLTYPDAEATFVRFSSDFHLPTLTGLTNLEAELLQRKEVETRVAFDPVTRQAQYGDARPHAFDAYATDASQSNWSWHLDSRVPGGCVRGRWSPINRQRSLSWGTAWSFDLARGARPVVVVEL